jgi:hypothetical protein
MGSIDMTTIELPTVLRDRLRTMKVHPNQAYYDLIEDALDFWDDAVRPRGVA